MITSKKFTMFYQTFDRIVKNIKRLAAPVMSRYGLRGVHAVCILELDRCQGGMTVTEIAAKCMVDKALSSRMVRELLNGGFIVACPGASETRYNQRYMPTPRVREIVKELNVVIMDYVAEAGKDIPAKDLTVFYRVLAGLDRNIESITEKQTT